MIDIVKGKVYQIHHKRKGIFEIKVISISLNDEWVNCLIINGIADAMLGQNTKGKGGYITIRKSLITHAEEL